MEEDEAKQKMAQLLADEYPHLKARTSSTGAGDTEVEDLTASLASRLQIYRKDEVNTDMMLTNMREAYELFLASGYPQRPAYPAPKSRQEAEKFRILGINSFKQADYQAALYFSTQSIVSAPPDSKELTAAYNERAHTLFKLELYDNCLLDLNRALKGMTSEKEKKPLRMRKKACMQQIRSRKTSWGADSVISDALCPQQLLGNNDETTYDKSLYKSLWETSNLRIPDTSGRVELKYDAESRTCYMVATGDFASGEIISFEKYFATTLIPAKRSTRCANCFLGAFPMIPCTSCTLEMYCSEFCRKVAYDSYHRTECQLMKFYERRQNKKIDFREVIALRAFLTATNQGDLLPTLMKELPLNDIIDKEFAPPNLSSSVELDYIESINLWKVVLVNETEFVRKFAKQTLIPVIEMVLALRALSFFGEDNPTNVLSEKETFAVLLLVQQYLSVSRGYHYIMYQEDRKSPAEATLGFGICRIQNLLKFSCNPNTAVCFENRYRQMYTIRPIKKGEPITYSRPHLFADTPVKFRNEICPNGVVCQCEACANNWPMLAELEKRQIEYLPGCTKEGLLEALREIENQFGSETGMAASRLFIAIHCLLQVFYLHVSTPSYEIWMAEDLLVAAMKSLYSSHHFKDHTINERFRDLYFTLVARVNKVIANESDP